MSLKSFLSRYRSEPAAKAALDDVRRKFQHPGVPTGPMIGDPPEDIWAWAKRRVAEREAKKKRK
jgi:hypothetical protein